MPQVITIYGLLSIVAASAAYFIAGRKQRNSDGWAFACFILPPLVLILAFLGKAQTPHHIKVEEQHRRKLSQMMND